VLFQAEKNQARCSNCGNLYRIEPVKILPKWVKLRNWLSNLLVQSSVSTTEKRGIKMALDIMDRIDEND
jgi:hypothetical protein